MISDEASVQDTLRATTTKPIFDEATVEDLITWLLVRRIFDETATVDDIIYKPPVTLLIADEASVQDMLRATPTKQIFDEVTVDDDIFRNGMKVRDEIGTTEDIVYKAPVTIVISDEASVQDTLRVTTTTTKQIFDEVTVDDDIFRIEMQVRDEIGTTDDIVYKAPVTIVLSAEASVQDLLRTTTIRRIQ